MANLIDYTYFVDDINVPDANGTYSTLDDFITKFEKKYLIRVLGYTLYKLIAAYDSAHPEASEQRIRDIIEGKEFQSDDLVFTYKWNGLKNTDLISPIAYYVYYHHQVSKITHTSTSGEKKNAIENSQPVETSFKLYDAWNNMVDLTGKINDYKVDSLYYFMYKNADTYPEWEFEEFDYINSFGI